METEIALHLVDDADHEPWHAGTLRHTLIARPVGDDLACGKLDRLLSLRPDLAIAPQRCIFCPALVERRRVFLRHSLAPSNVTRVMSP